MSAWGKSWGRAFGSAWGAITKRIRKPSRVVRGLLVLRSVVASPRDRSVQAVHTSRTLTAKAKAMRAVNASLQSLRGVITRMQSRSITSGAPTQRKVSNMATVADVSPMDSQETVKILFDFTAELEGDTFNPSSVAVHIDKRNGMHDPTAAMLAKPPEVQAGDKSLLVFFYGDDRPGTYAIRVVVAKSSDVAVKLVGVARIQVART